MIGFVFNFQTFQLDSSTGMKITEFQNRMVQRVLEIRNKLQLLAFAHWNWHNKWFKTIALIFERSVDRQQIELYLWLSTTKNEFDRLRKEERKNTKYIESFQHFRGEKWLLNYENTFYVTLVKYGASLYNAGLINLDPRICDAWPANAHFFLPLHITHSDFAAHIQS